MDNIHKGEKYDLLSFIYDKKFELVSKYLNLDFDNSCEKCNQATNQNYFNFQDIIEKYNTSLEDKIGFVINTSNFYKTKIGIIVSSNILLTANTEKNDFGESECYNLFINNYNIYWIKLLKDSKCSSFQYLIYTIETSLIESIGMGIKEPYNSVIYVKPEDIKSKKTPIYTARYIYSERSFQFISSSQIIQMAISKSTLLFTPEFKIIVLKEEENIFINNIISIFKSNKEVPSGKAFLNNNNLYLISQSEFVKQCKSNSEEYLLENMFKIKDTSNFSLIANKIDKLQNNDHHIICCSKDSNCSLVKEDYKLILNSNNFNLNGLNYPNVYKNFNSQIDTMYKFKKNIFFTQFNTNNKFKRKYLIFLIQKTNIVDFVSLSNLPIKYKGFLKDILNSILYSNSIRKIDFSGFKPFETIEYSNIIVDFFSKVENIQEITMENCDITDEFMLKCLEAFNKNNSIRNKLENINLNSNFLSNKTFEELTKTIISKDNLFKNFRKLSFANNNLTRIPSIDSLLFLEHLNLYNNMIDDDEAEQINKLCSKSSACLSYLNLGKTKITPKFLINLSTSIKDNNFISFEYLNFSNNMLDDYSINLISDYVLKKQHKLCHLDISNTRIKDITNLINNLKLNSSLKILNLNNNLIESDSFNNLLISSCFSNLTKLFIANNMITTIRPDFLSDFLKTNDSLTDLDLSGNMINIKELKKISTFIKYYAQESYLVDINLKDQVVNELNEKKEVEDLYEILGKSSSREVSLSDLFVEAKNFTESKREIFSLISIVKATNKIINKNGMLVSVNV